MLVEGTSNLQKQPKKKAKKKKNTLFSPTTFLTPQTLNPTGSNLPFQPTNPHQKKRRKKRSPDPFRAKATNAVETLQMSGPGPGFICCWRGSMVHRNPGILGKIPEIVAKLSRNRGNSPVSGVVVFSDGLELLILYQKQEIVLAACGGRLMFFWKF